ncbi:MAG: hypothetical protein MK214_14645 [Thalassotalea sp.]|nr:hypothetical protein [Thalassotalea sp.]
MLRLTLTVLLLTMSFASFAHSGHDHTSPMAALVHLLWLAPLFIGAAALRAYMTKQKAQQKNNHQD